MARKKLGEMLIEAGLVDESSVRAALTEQQRWGGSLGRALVEMRLIDESALISTLSTQLAIPTVDLDQVAVPRAVIDMVPGDLCERHSVVPFAQLAKFLDVAMADPTNLGIIDELRIRTKLFVRPYLAGPKMIERALRKYYGRGVGWGGPSGDGNRHSGVFEVVHSGDAQGRRRRTSAPPPAISEARASATIDAQRMRDAEIAALQERLSRLEAMVARDEDVLRKLLALLVDKDLATREEILERIR